MQSRYYQRHCDLLYHLENAEELPTQETTVHDGATRPTENSGGEHVLPVVPVVVDPRHGDHRGEQQRQGDDAELGDVPSPVERPDLAGQVPGQEAQPGERPCEAQGVQCSVAAAACKQTKWLPYRTVE